MSNNKSNSPFFAIGQGINQLLDYRMIARAGAPRNFLGTAIGAVGSLISRLDFSEMSKDKETPAEVTADELKSVGMGEEYKGFGGGYGKEYDFGAMLDKYPELDKFYFLTNKGKEKVTTSSTKGDGKGGKRPDGMPDADMNTGKGGGITNTQKKNFIAQYQFRKKLLTGDDPIAGFDDMGLPIKAKDVNYEGDPINIQAKLKAPEGFYYDKEGNLKPLGFIARGAGQAANFFGKVFRDMTTVGNRYDGLKTPTSSSKRLRPEILEIIEDSRYKRKGKDDTKLHRIGYFLRSPFYQTKNRPYKELAKVAETPGDAFSLLPGGINPATQAYNAVIESENYRRRIENEFDEDLTKEVSSLNVDLSKANVSGQQRQDLLDLSLNNKKQLSEAFQKYADGKMSKSEYEMLKTNLLAEVNTLSSDLGLIKAKAADFLKNKDNIDLPASNPEVADFYQTAIKNPDSIRIVEINGTKYFKGTTNGGKDFQIEVGAISNGDASFLLTEKADPTKFISGALNAMTGFVVEGKTAMGMGEMQLPDDTKMVDGKLVKSKIRTIGENSLVANLNQNPDMVRSLLAQFRGINYEGYQTLINQDRDGDGKTTSQEIQQNEQEMLLQLAEEMYDEFVAPQYNPRSKTTRMNTQGGGTKLTQAERDRRTRDAYIASLPNPTEENFGDYRDIIGKDFTYTIEDGTLKIKKQNQKEGFSSIKLNDPKFKDFIKKFVDPNLTTTKLGTQNNTQVTNTGDADPLGII